MSNKPNNSGDGELMALLFSGAAAGWGGYLLSTHLSPDSWPNVILGRLAHLAGQQPSPRMDAIMAAVLAFVVGVGAAMIVADYFHRGKQKKAALKAGRAALEIEQAKDALAAKCRTDASNRKTLDAIAKAQARAEAREQQPRQATLGFVLVCAGGFTVAAFIIAHFLL